MVRADTVVVGSGICGLTIANGLRRRGEHVVVVDKGRRPGGRFSSRPVRGVLLDMGPVSLGAPHRFESVLDALAQASEQAGLHTEPFAAADGVVTWGRPASACAEVWAEGLDVRQGLVTHVEPEPGGGVAVVCDGAGQRVSGSRVVLTPPAPQVVHLLANSGLAVPEELVACSYEMRMVLVVFVADATSVAAPLASEFAAIRTVTQGDGGAAVSLIASAAWSTQAWAQDANQTEAQLLLELRRMCPQVRVLEADLKRWRYANPTRGVAAGHLAVTCSGDATPDVVVAGDAFAADDPAREGVERALRSALSVLSVLSA